MLSSRMAYKTTALFMGFLVLCSGFVINNAIRTSSRLFSKKPQSKLPEGFQFTENIDGYFVGIKPKKPKALFRIDRVDVLRQFIAKGYKVRHLDVRGNTTSSDTVSRIHPVVKALYDRKLHNSIPGNRTDNRRIAIAVEGGGMRGCVGAGMITAFWYLGLQDCIDVVYGSSAGSLVGAYFISGQLPYYGPEMYYDVLTSAGRDFIDLQAVIRSAGLGALDLRYNSLRSLYTDRLGKPVLNLDYLFDTIVQKIKPMDWKTFWEKQINKKIELKIVASGLLSGKAVVMSAENRNFQTMSELAQCMKASMLLPGITGEAIRLKGSQAEGGNILTTEWPEHVSRTQSRVVHGTEPLTDAQLYEPIPYRSAIRENCTHVIALRTKPDDRSVTVSMSLVERMIMSRFFGRKLGMPHLVAWMGRQYHKLVYAEDILILNAANREFNETDTDPPTPRLYCIAVPAGTPEVKRLETSRRVIFNSVREGFAAAYDALVQDPADRGKGMQVAKEIWPDSILTQPLAHLSSSDSAAISNATTTSEINDHTVVVSDGGDDGKKRRVMPGIGSLFKTKK